MNDLRLIAPSCGVLLGTNAHGHFEHVGTAWCVGPNEWVTAWSSDETPGNLRLMTVNGGATATLSGWEAEGGIAGFTATLPGDIPVLPLRRNKVLHKRDPLWAMGYPSTIDHPEFHLHRGSLDAERYFPYLCPWTLSGHLALFSANDGYLTGRCYTGMAGGPVLDDEGHVVGVLLDGHAAPDHPPLARFHRLI